jgi:biotin carboxyl carrier protein
MSAASIQAKVKAGLAKAIAATGSPTSEKVYLVKFVTVGGDPFGGGTTTETNILLTNATFKSYNAKLFGGTMLASDVALVCDGDVVIKQGDVIKQGLKLFTVEAMDVKAPTSDVLGYILMLRTK